MSVPWVLAVNATPDDPRDVDDEVLQPIGRRERVQPGSRPSMQSTHRRGLRSSSGRAGPGRAWSPAPGLASSDYGTAAGRWCWQQRASSAGNSSSGPQAPASRRRRFSRPSRRPTPKDSTSLLPKVAGSCSRPFQTTRTHAWSLEGWEREPPSRLDVDADCIVELDLDSTGTLTLLAPEGQELTVDISAQNPGRLYERPARRAIRMASAVVGNRPTAHSGALQLPSGAGASSRRRPRISPRCRRALRTRRPSASPSTPGSTSASSA